MAEGEDGLELRSRVQLLDGPFYEGQYLIGSVNFVRSATPAGSSNTEGISCTLLHHRIIGFF